MIPFVLTSMAISLPPLAVALWRPQAGRILFGLIYLAGGIFNLTVTRVNPLPLFTWGADHALFPLYEDLLRGWILPHASWFALLIGGLGELTCAALILSRGRAVKRGLLGAIAFNLAISPLHPGVLAGNLLLIAAEVWLLFQAFPRHVLERAPRAVVVG